MTNIVTQKTTKEQMLEDYKNYPSTLPKGIEPYHQSRIHPIYYEIKPHTKVLDIGCNDGTFIELLKKRHCNAIGVDVSDTALEKAREKGCEVYKMDGESLTFPDNHFDYVTLMEVLVHVHNPSKLLKEIHRVLKPKGVLMGSAPHKNLESYMWDDKRMHHRYYDELTLEKELKKSFKNVHLKVLKGGQFSVNFANSFLAGEPVEMLFKCSDKPKPWDEALLDTKPCRVYMGFTQNPGDVHYRLKVYADKMRQQKGMEIAYQDFDYNSNESPGVWQTYVVQSPSNPGRPNNSVATEQLGSLLKVADVHIFQLTALRDVIAFFHCIKDLFKKKFVTETDDWIFDLPGYNVASNPYKPNSDAEWCAMEQLKLSDYIICSTQFIKENLEKIYPKKKIYVVRNTVDFKLWENAKSDKMYPKKKEGQVRIVYSGCGNHSGDLELIVKPMQAILDEFSNVEFILPIEFESIKKIKSDRVKTVGRWLPVPLYPSMMKGWDGDIGIAPLRDNYFNRAKSNLRWLEYSALKIPTIASPVYPFTTSIKKGEDGILCESPKDWYDNLRELITNRGRREDIGEKAYEHVKSEYSADDEAKKYADILKEIKSDGPFGNSS